MSSYPAAYQSTKGSALDVNRDFYQALADGKRTQISEHLVPIRTGYAWKSPLVIFSESPLRKARKLAI
ncbi:hypothetical protein ABC733_23720 [Mangrovibacter sp. SLW1]